MSQEYKLKHPIQFGSELIETVTVCRPKGKHMRKFSGNEKDMDANIKFLGSVIGQCDPVMDMMDYQDITALMEIVAGFLSDGQATG